MLVHFPFSDLSESKLRPAVVMAASGRGDFVLIQITSRAYSDPAALELSDVSFQEGGLNRVSYARPGKLFTANESLIERRVGQLTDTVIDDVTEAIVGLLRSGG